MQKAMRKSTLESLGLGSVLEIFQRGGLPVDAAGLVDKVFGPADDRGCMVVSGGNGIVGAGKVIQFASRLEPYGVTVVALDFPGAPAGLAKQYEGLVRSFGKEQAARIMSSVVQLTYDGKSLPRQLAALKPRFLLEAVPEILEVKKAHYAVFREAFPGIEIRSVTSGFPAHELGVGVAHPAYPHEINKVWEMVEAEPSALTQLFWALGLIPMTMSDHWSFVLDVLFCGAMQAACRYHDATNMPVWKADKLVRRLLGPNPFRAHDAIGAKGSTFLTWSCLDHLAKQYGPLFQPSPTLVAHKDSGQDWYPPNHFRPVVGWPVDEAANAEFDVRILGPLFQMLALILHEKRASLPEMNAIGELCAQFKTGALAMARALGRERVTALVEQYHKLEPAAAQSPWHPEALAAMDTPEGQQLYVNAEHDGTVGVISISRESYGWDVDAELNRAIDWLKAQAIERVIVTGDFHLATQMTGADTGDFFAIFNDVEKGIELCRAWSATGRRLNDEFKASVAFINGKRCLGGFLELVSHCHYLVAVDTASLGMPEVGLPVVPGMEGCHWLFRKAAPGDWPKLFSLMLEGKPVAARDGLGWLTDAAAPLHEAIAIAWALARGEAAVPRRSLDSGPLADVAAHIPALKPASNAGLEAGRKAILDSITRSCAAPLAEALEFQAEASARFMASPACRAGRVGAAYTKAMTV
jgi:enoyl-CoA hydratase/carnithine racemase/3-hydroxyacyl-CoA dehydrogenase